MEIRFEGIDYCPYQSHTVCGCGADGILDPTKKMLWPDGATLKIVIRQPTSRDVVVTLPHECVYNDLVRSVATAVRKRVDNVDLALSHHPVLMMKANRVIMQKEAKLLTNKQSYFAQTDSDAILATRPVVAAQWSADKVPFTWQFTGLLLPQPTTKHKDRLQRRFLGRFTRCTQS
jgi:hypothetical protein